MEIYQIYDDITNEHLANLIYDSKKNEFTSELLVEEPKIILFADFNYGDIIWGAEPHPKSIYIENWLKDRVIPENRDMLKEVLARRGIYQYDWRVLIKLNKGRTTSDDLRIEVIEYKDD